MKRYLAVGVYILLMSCGADSTEIGSQFFDDSSLDFFYIDSTTVSLSTVQYEKLVTSSNSRLLLGTYVDPKLGALNSSSFVQFKAPSSIDDLKDADISYDYLAVVLNYDQYVYYDTTKLKIDVYEVAEDIDLEDDSYLYNSSTFEVKSDVLGSRTFVPRPHRDDTVEIVLSDELGLELFSKIRDGDEQLDTDAFPKYMRGLAFVPDPSVTSGIIGFSSSPEIRLYYTDRGETPVKQKYVSFESNRYNSYLKTDRSATSIVSLPQDEKLGAEYTNDEAYLQSGAGLALRVDFPYLTTLKQFPDLHVVQAVLEIYPVKKTFDELTPLPTQLTVYAVDGSNDQYGTLESSAVLITDKDTGRYTRHVLDVTSFVNSQLALDAYNENGLLFINTGFTSTVDRLCAASASYEYNTRVKIYFATIIN